MAPLPEPGPDVQTVIKLASNESALGPSPRAVERAQAMCTRMQWYAEREGTQPLQRAIAARFDLDPDRVVVGPGSDEILSRLIRGYLRLGEELIFNERGYAKFGNYAHSVDAVPIAAPDSDYVADVDAILSRVSGRTRIVALANPDNPTGTYLPVDEVLRLRQALPDDVLLILDGAYAEYVNSEDFDAGISLADRYDNVAITRTFSKIFGLAGLRLGWAYAAPAVIDTLRRLSTTFPVSSIAIAAGIEAMADRDHTEKVRRHNERWRTWLTDQLTGLGFHCIPSQTNFLLADTAAAGVSPETLDQFLLERGILIRRFPRPGLDHCVRVTIGADSDMLALGEALGQLAPQIEGARS